MMQLVMTVCYDGAFMGEGIAQWVRWPCGRRFEHIVRYNGRDIQRWTAGREYELRIDAYARNRDRAGRAAPERDLTETTAQQAVSVWTS